MFHYVNAIQNTKGDALIGYFVKAVNPATGEVVSIYADENRTPIESVSGVENAAEVNSDGNASFYTDDGEFHLDVYATDSTTFVLRFEDIPMVKVGMLKVATVGDLANANTSYPVILTEAGRKGIFDFDESDLSAEVSADPGQTTYVAPSSDETGASGAWERIITGVVVQQPDTTSTGIVEGCGVAYISNLTFELSAGSYRIDGILYHADAQEVTLDAADATNPRIDVLYVDSEGLFGKITGTPAVSPSQPAVDPASQLYLTFVLVPATATSLSGITNENIYLEGVEWTVSTSGTGFTANSTTNPYAGTKDIEGTAVTAGSYVRFVRSSPMSFDGDGNLTLRIRSKATWNSKRWLTLQFFNGGVAKGGAISLKSGTFGYDSSSTSGYQLIVINKSLFAIAAGTQVDELRIVDVGGSIGFYLDNIILQNVGSTTGTSDPGFTQAMADARYVLQSRVSDAAYDASSWNGSTDLATKNAIRDKIEALAPGGVISGALLPANNLSDVNSAATSRTNLGLGSAALLASSAVLQSANNLSDVANAGTSRTNLGLGSMATQASSSVSITGGSVTGIADLAVADGGTGASSASAARTNLGVSIGTDVKAQAPSVQSVASSATVTPTFTDDGVKVTAQATGLTLANPSGTPVSMWGWAIRIKDNGSARSVAFGSQYRAIGVTLPTTTVVNKTLYLGCIWNNDDTKVDVVSVAQEA